MPSISCLHVIIKNGMCIKNIMYIFFQILQSRFQTTSQRWQVRYNKYATINRKFREEARPVVYLNVTWLNKICNEGRLGGLSCDIYLCLWVSSWRSWAFCLIWEWLSSYHCGYRFMIPGSAFIFDSKTGIQDYHDEMELRKLHEVVHWAVTS